MGYIIIWCLCGFMLGGTICSAIDCYRYRKSRNEKWSKGRSYCEGCRKELHYWQLIPVFGGLATKGKCPYCGYEFGTRYAIRELIFGCATVVVTLSGYYVMRTFNI